MNDRSQKNLINRYIWLYQTISTFQPISFQEIAAQWEIAELNELHERLPRKTFDNHRKAVEEIFDVNVDCGSGFKYRITSESPAREDILKLMGNALVLNRFVSEREMGGKVALEHIDGNPSYLSIIFGAIKGERSLLLRYRHNYDTTREELVIVKPIGVKLFRQRWYLVAEPPDSSVYSYPLDRIISLEAGTRAGAPSLSLDELFRDNFGIIRETDKPPVDIDIKVEQEQARYFKSVPLHHSQQLVEDTPAYTIFRLHVSPTYDFIMELMSHGNRVEVLAPPSLRASMAARALDLANLYR